MTDVCFQLTQSLQKRLVSTNKTDNEGPSDDNSLQDMCLTEKQKALYIVFIKFKIWQPDRLIKTKPLNIKEILFYK